MLHSKDLLPTIRSRQAQLDVYWQEHGVHVAMAFFELEVKAMLPLLDIDAVLQNLQQLFTREAR